MGLAGLLSFCKGDTHGHFGVGKVMVGIYEKASMQHSMLRSFYIMKLMYVKRVNSASTCSNTALGSLPSSLAFLSCLLHSRPRQIPHADIASRPLRYIRTVMNYHEQ